MYRKTIFLWVAIIATAMPAAAQTSNARFMFSSGGSFVKGERTFIANGDSFRTEYAKGGKAALRGTMDWGRHFGFEGTYSFGTNNLRLFELSETPIVQRDFGVRVHQFTGNALAFVNDDQNRLRVFGTFGLGLQRFTPTKEAKTAAAATKFIDHPAALAASNSLAFNFGGGVEAAATSRFGIRFDFRDHVSSVPRYGVPQASTGTGGDFYPVSGRVQNIELTVGLMFYLVPRSERGK